MSPSGGFFSHANLWPDRAWNNRVEQMAIEFSHIVPFLPVRDLKKTIEYYRDVLGFSKEWYWENTDAGIQRDGMRLLFTNQPAHAALINSAGWHLEICWFVSGVDELYEEYKKKGVKIVDELQDAPWGTRGFTIEEINGYCLRIAQGIEKSE